MNSPDHAPLSLEGIHEIPDPAAGVAADPVPPPRPPDGRSPTRADRRLLGRASIVFGLAWLATACLIFGLRPDVASLHVTLPIAAWLMGGAILLGVVLRPRARGLPAGVRAVQHAVWIVPAAYVIGAMVIAAPADDPVTWTNVRGCIALSSLMAVGPLAAAALFLRGSFFSAPGWRGAAVGALAGLAGSIGVHAHCSIQGISHLLMAHGAAIAAGAAAGAALGRLGGRP